MKEEDIFALAKAMVEVGQAKNFGQHHKGIINAIDGVSDSIKELNITIQDIASNIDMIETNIR